MLAQLRGIYIARTSKRFNLHVAYQLRNFKEVWPMLSADRTNEYLFVSTGVDVSRGLTVGLSEFVAADDEP